MDLEKCINPMELFLSDILIQEKRKVHVSMFSKMDLISKAK